MNILDYIKWRGDIDFQYDSFNEVDNLILARLSYLPFEKLNNVNNLTIKELYNKMLDLNLLPSDYLHNYDIDLLRLLAYNKRFNNIRISNFIFNTNVEQEIQFCAMTFVLPNNTIYVAYRGTDNTIIGWKEDFDIAYKESIPSQQLALNYLNNISFLFKKVYVGGHSKGGNLAMYASIYTSDAIKKKIIKIYNNDGPGFLDKIINSEEYNNIKDKICTFVPQTSIVGKLLNNTSNYIVIKSDEKFAMQHDPYSWLIEKSSFIYLYDTDKESKIIDKATSIWLTKASIEDRERFINLAYNTLTKTNSSTLRELSGKKLELIKIIYNEYKNLSNDDKELVDKIINCSISSLKEGILKKDE